MDSGCRAERRLLTQLQLSIGPSRGLEASDRPRRRGSKPPIFSRNGCIDRQGLERLLDCRQSPQASGAYLVRPGDQNPEMQLRQRHCAGCYLSLNLTRIGSEEDTRVENAPHLAKGSLTPWSTKSRSLAQSSSDGPSNTATMSSHVRHCMRCSGPSSATSRPLTVTVTVSPSSARRTKSLACWRSSRSPALAITRWSHLCYRGAIAAPKHAAVKNEC